jgi:iron complex transport system substrate-binding protein
MRKFLNLVLLGAAMAVGLGGPAAIAEIVIKDLAGREVTLEGPAKRLIIGEGRFFTSLALLTDNPDDIIVGMQGEFEKFDPAGYAAFKTQFPKIDGIARIGNTSPDSVSAEKIITLNPDVAIFGLRGHGPSIDNKELIAQLEAAGISVVFIDFSIDILNNTPKSIEVIGKVIGKEKRASEFIDYYEGKKSLVANRVKDLNETEKPTTFIEVHAGKIECCTSMANGMLGSLIEFAGGINISAKATPAVVGHHTLEFLIAEDPDILIGTASGAVGGQADKEKPLSLGIGINEAEERDILKGLAHRPGFDVLSAVRNARIYGIWHNFYNSAWNIYVLMAFAKWQHPTLFADISLQEEMREMQERFLPFQPGGLFSIGLKGQ